MQIRKFKEADAAETSWLIKERYLKLDIGGHTKKGIALQIEGNSAENKTK